MTRPRRQLGFTLLELILATGTAAMLALALYASMNVAMKARRSAQAAVGTLREPMIALEIVAEALASAPRPNGVIAGPFVGVPSGGDATRNDLVNFFTFAGTPGDAQVADGVAQVEFALIADGDAYALVRRMQRNPLATITTTPEDEVLCRRVASFGLRYFDGTSWRDAWDSAAEDNDLPRAVEVTLAVQPEGAGTPGAQPTRVMRVVPLACAPTAEEQLQEGGSR